MRRGNAEVEFGDPPGVTPFTNVPGDYPTRSALPVIV